MGAKMNAKFGTFFGLLTATFMLVNPLTANAGLLGASVTGTPLFPDTTTLGGTGHASGPVTVIDPGYEFPEGLILYSGDIDITDSQIFWIPTVSTTYLTASFNGFKLDFLGAPAITSLTLNPASLLSATDITFDSDTIFLNFSGKTVVAGEAAIFDVNRVPEPSTALLFGIGLAVLGSMRRRKP